MTIMAIIAAAILGTAAAAIESAREKRTQSLITKIHTLVMERYSSYDTRRVDIQQRWLDSINTMNPPAELRGRMMADLRLLALRELMKYEMPECSDDYMAAPVFLRNRPPLAKQYELRLGAAPGKNVGAECLYRIVMDSTGDGEARTLFSKQDVGDTDSDGPDGNLEFVDGWGNAIEFVRWPAGYFVNSALMTGDGSADHDPFDPYRRDDKEALPVANSYPTLWRPYVSGLRDSHAAFRLVPLIVSFGPDGADGGEVDIFLFRGDWSSIAAEQPAMNPYFTNSSVQQSATKLGIPAYGSGMPDLDDGVDLTKNYITNHNVEY